MIKSGACSPLPNSFYFLVGFFVWKWEGGLPLWRELKRGVEGRLNDCNVLGVSPSLFDSFLRGPSKRRQRSKFKGIQNHTPVQLKASTAKER